jgi:hypothetical protein
MMFLLNPSMRFDPAQTKIIAMGGCQWEPLVLDSDPQGPARCEMGIRVPQELLLRVDEVVR